MQIKGNLHPFIPMQPAAEPNSKESAGSRADAAVPDAAAPAPRPRAPLGRSTAYKLLKQFAASPGPQRAGQRAGQRPPEAKGRMQTDSAVTRPEPGLTVSAAPEVTQASSASQFSPATAVTKLFLGTPEEKTAAQKFLVDVAGAIIGPNHLTVAAELALWSDRPLRRPGF